MMRLFRVAVLTLILALLIPVLLDRLSILNEYGEYGADGKYGKQIGPPPEIKPRSAYRAEVTKGKEAISRLKENHLISVSERVLDEVRLPDSRQERMREKSRQEAGRREATLRMEAALRSMRGLPGSSMKRAHDEVRRQAEIIREKEAILGSKEDPRILAGEERALADDRLALAKERASEGVRLVAASDYQGKVVVVAGKHSQLYVFRKERDSYLLKQVLWDGAANSPLSLAITENGRYAVMMSGDTAIGNIGKFDNRLLQRKLHLVIWDIEKEEKVQEMWPSSGEYFIAEMIGSARIRRPLTTAGRTLVWGGSSLLNADLSGKKERSDAYVKLPEFFSGESMQIAYAPLTHQILVNKDVNKNNLALYKVRDEARDKWWKWWSNDIALEEIPDSFQACSEEESKCSLNALFPAFEVSPDGTFFVILRQDGMLEAYSVPDGTFLSSIQTPDDVRVAREPHLTILDGVVYLANGINSSDGDGNGNDGFWSWTPGSAQLRSHELLCADYTRLLNNGYIATLGCRDDGMELRLVALADPSRIERFSQPLRLR